MDRIGVQLGKSPPVTRIDRAPASSARHPAVMVRFASQQRLAFPFEFRLLRSLRPAALEVRFSLHVRARADIRSHGQSHLAITPSPSSSRVEFKHLHGAGGSSHGGNYSIAEITPESH